MLAYAAIALAWGGWWPVAKVAIGEVPPIELSVIRFALVGAILLVAMAILRIPLGRHDLGAVLAAAALGVFGYNVLVPVALTMAPASDGALIVPTMVPVLTALFATAIGERLTRSKVTGFAVSSVGAALVILGAQGLGGAVSAERLAADLMSLGGAACWSGYSVVGRIAMRQRSPVALVALTATIGAVMLFPLGFLERGYRDVAAWSTAAWLELGYIAVVATIIGFVLYYWAVRRFGAGVGALVGYLVPVAALLLTVAFLGERPQPIQLAGGAVILAGVRIATLGPRRAEVIEAAA